MAVELATAYISLVADTSKLPKQIGSALGQAQQQAEQAGVGIGSRLSSGLGKTLKVGAAGVAAAAGTTIGLAFAKGMGRLTAIDDAQGKLRGLGHDAGTVQTIMDGALASVKGTAFGLGDAAGIAAGAVAAGIKPGQDLERTLKLVGDAASIAGTDLGSMGAIFNKVAAANKIQGDVIAQLSDAGIPVISMLGKELGKSSEEVVKLASAGKINFETFQNSMQKGLGGAALESGKTVSGSIKNLNAGLGRLGAEALKPTFSRLGGGVGGLTAALDKMTPKVGELSKALDHKVFDEGLPKLRTEWEKFSKTDFATGTVSKSVTILDQLRSTAEATAPAVKDIGKAFAEASAVTGGAGLTLGLQTLTGVTTAAAGPLTSALNTAANFAKENQGLVTAALMGYAGVKGINWLAQTKQMQGLQSAVTGTSGSFRAATGTMAAMRAVSASTGQEMSRLGAGVAYLSTGQGSVGKLAQAFQSGRANADKFGRTMGVASAAGTGLKLAAGGVSSMLGGPLGMALGAGTAAMAIYGAQTAKTAAEHRQIVENSKDLGAALATSNGAWTAQTQAAAASALSQQKLAGSGRSLAEYLESIGVSGQVAAKGLAGSRTEMEATLKVLEKKALEEEAYQRDVSSKDLSLQGIKNAGKELFNYQGYNDKQHEQRNAFADYKKLNDQARLAAAEQRRVMQSMNLLDTSGTATGIGIMSEAMKAFATSTGGAAEKIDIIRGGLSTLFADQNTVADTEQRIQRGFRAVTAAMEAGGAAAVDASGKIDQTGAAGDQLHEAMKTVQQGFVGAMSLAKTQSAQANEGFAEQAAAAEAAGQKVRDEFVNQAALLLGTREKAEELANQYGLFPKDLSTKINLDATQANNDLQFWLKQPRSLSVGVDMVWNSDLANQRAAAMWGQGIAGPVSGVAYADGGIHNYLPQQATIQPGRGGGLVQWAEGETGGEAFIPLSPAKRGRSTDILADVAQRFGFGLTKFADGGIQNALNAGRANVKKYLWGGTGMDGWDCSGWVGWLQQIVMGASGVEAAGKRLYTTYSLLSGQTAGLRPGLGPAGTQFQVGVSQEHMAATIGGQPAESGGAHGASRIGAPAVGATDPQFSHWFYLPNEMVAGGVDRSGIVSAYQSIKDAKPWTDDNEDDLLEARLRVRQEEQSLTETQSRLAEGKATQVDLDRANLDLKRANKKVTELEAQREASKAGRYLAPQAPELSKRFTDSEMERLDAQLALDEANDHRNEIYDDPESSERDRLRADMDLSKAQDAFDDVLSGKSKTGQDYSLKGIAKTFLDRAGDAVIEGAFAQLPFDLGESRWVTTDWKSLVPDQTFSREEIEGQLPTTPGVSDWAKTVLDAVDAQKGGPFDPEEIRKRLNVFDNGGWLEPGGMAINLSNRPEPIFNSPDQLRQFAGQLHAPERQRQVVDNSIHIGDVQTADINEFKTMIRVEQQRRTLGFRSRR